ncbi:glycosyl transferase family 1, partial [Pseudomonas syringae]|nr:glycosyl transferase family 1 [Pseudomonas syringae]
MIKVLHFFKTYYPDTTGGIEQVIFQLAQGCRAFDVESQVLTLSPSPSPPPPLIHISEPTRPCT